MSGGGRRLEFCWNGRLRRLRWAFRCWADFKKRLVFRAFLPVFDRT